MKYQITARNLPEKSNIAVNKNHNKIGIIFELLYKISKTEPDSQIKEYARESMKKSKSDIPCRHLFI